MTIGLSFNFADTSRRPLLSCELSDAPLDAGGTDEPVGLVPPVVLAPDVGREPDVGVVGLQ